VIALDANILNSALETQVEYGMSGQDAIVLASVLYHLHAHQPGESCFLNRNTKDFDDPDIREKLGGYGCKFFGNFERGLLYLVAQTSPK